MSNNKQQKDWFKKTPSKPDGGVSPASKNANGPKKKFFNFQQNSSKIRVPKPPKRNLEKFWRRYVLNRPILTRILYTLLMLLIFRIAASITLPGISINKEFVNSVNNSNSFLGIMDLIGGGTIRNFSVVALGISPYITASIIVQLLTSEVFPPLHRLNKSGPVGKRKINIMTRFITFFFAILQSVTMIQQLESGGLSIAPELNTRLIKFLAMPIILVAGSFFALFLGEQITNRGVGNGTSLIIFSGIAVELPAQFRSAYAELVVGNSANSGFIGGMNLTIYVLAFLLLIFIIGYFYLTERRVPIQQTGAGLVMDRSQLSYLPIKLNPAGVMPVVFSLAITVLPVTVVQFFDHQNLGRIWVEENLRITSPIGLSIFIVLTFLFTIVMSIVMFNTYSIADGFKKNSTFILGVRPGKETEKYLSGILLRLALFSAFYLSIISSLQYFEELAGMSASIAFGGTGTIILVTVGIETIDQLRARDKTAKIARARRNVINRASNFEKTGGLLW